jgi:asparagine synthase (glutamine-hydrolysing)
MLDAQAAYGPHATAQWSDQDVALGRRLFRSLPEDRYDVGVVPMDCGGRMVADVRLDNRSELAAGLGIAPGQARSLADASLLAAAWTRWGEDCFERLVGDYAFALWDTRGCRLVLARDAFGHRPLFFHRAPRFIAFASMPRGLHALGDVPQAPDEAHLAAFLALRPERGSATFFEGVERVEPGGVAFIDRDGVSTRRHYAPARRTLRLSGPAAYAEALREHLDRAVGARLRGAEVQVGAHLSSGWDSSAVAATAARLLAPCQGRVVAFTAAPRAGYRDPAPRGRHGDESQGAAEVAALYENMDHVQLRASGRSPLEDLDRDIALSGRPTLNPCNHVWFNDINKAARARGIGILLTGDFGNLGLTADAVETLPDLVASGRWRSWWRLARAVANTGTLRWRGVVAASFESYLPAGTWRRLRRLSGQTLGQPGAHSALPPALWSKLGLIPSLDGGDWVGRRLAAMTRFDRAPYIKGALGAFGVDVRDPLSDRRLIEFCLSLPIDQLIADGRTRALARRALSDRLPSSILEQETRGYQAVDWHEGLTSDRASVARDLDRFAALPAAARILDVDRMRHLTARWPTGNWERDEVLDTYRLALLRGLAAGRFLTHTLRFNG